MNTLFHQFCEATTNEQCASIQAQLREGGFSLFRRFADDFHEAIKQYTDEEKDKLRTVLEKVRQWFPVPGSFSPAWQKLWDEYEDIMKYKNIALENVPQSDRDGEWQVIMDNPYTNQQVVCYPALKFMEAAYLYGYFHPGLEKNEYIRLQKIHTLLIAYGK